VPSLPAIRTFTKEVTADLLRTIKPPPPDTSDASSIADSQEIKRRP